MYSKKFISILLLITSLFLKNSDALAVNFFVDDYSPGQAPYGSYTTPRFIPPTDYMQMIHGKNLRSTIDGRGVKIVVIDDSGGNHSQTVCNIIGDNSTSMAPNCQLISQDLSYSDLVTSEGIAFDIRKAIKEKVDFINISLSFETDPWTFYDSKNPTSKLMRKREIPVSNEIYAACLEARDNGICIIKSAGNKGKPLDQDTVFSNSFLQLLEDMAGHMVIVTNFQKTDNLESRNPESSYPGKKFINHALSAPGTDIEACDARGVMMCRSGTSFSTPIVTGAAALLKARFSHLSPKEILDLLKNSARTWSIHDTNLARRVKFPSVYCGHGMIDLENAVRLASNSRNLCINPQVIFSLPYDFTESNNPSKRKFSKIESDFKGNIFDRLVYGSKQKRRRLLLQKEKSIRLSPLRNATQAPRHLPSMEEEEEEEENRVLSKDE